VRRKKKMTAATTPWGRPRLDDILMGIDHVLEHDQPARGEE